MSCDKRNTRDVFIRDVRRSGRWFPEKGCILEHQIFRFAKVILCDRCSTSDDLAPLFRGSGTLDRWSGNIAKRIGTRPSALHSTVHFLHRFWCSQLWKIDEGSRICLFFFNVVNFEIWGSLVDMFFSPQNCVGFLFLDWHPPPRGPPPPPPPPRPLCHTQSGHTQLCHIQIGHIQLCHTHTQLCHIQIGHTHNFVTYKFSPTTLSHTHNFVTHTQLCHTHNFVTHTTLSHTTLSHTTLSHTHTTLSHTTLSHTTLSQTTLSHTTLSHTHNFATHHFHTHNFVTHTTLPHTNSHMQIVMPRHFCVAGVALRDILRRFTWQAWHLALGDIQLRFAWQAWYFWDWAGSGDALGCRVVPQPFCVAGVALRDILGRFTWQAWHLATSSFVLRGRRGTYGTGPGLVTRLGAVAALLRGRRGTSWHPPSFHVAGVALGDILRRFTWQAWHLATLFCVAGVVLIGLGWVSHSHTASLSHTIFTHIFVTHHLCHTQLCHTPSFTHNFVTHNFVTHHLCHTQLCHTPFSHTHSFVTHHFHTSLSHTHNFVTHTHLCHTPSSTHNFVTHHLSHATLSHTIFHTHILATHHLSHTTICRSQFSNLSVLRHVFDGAPPCVNASDVLERCSALLYSHLTSSLWYPFLLLSLCRSQFSNLTAPASKFEGVPPCVNASDVLERFSALLYSHLTSSLWYPFLLLSLCRSQFSNLTAPASKFEGVPPCVNASDVLERFSALLYSHLTSSLWYPFLLLSLCRSQFSNLTAPASKFEGVPPCVNASDVLERFSALLYSHLTSSLWYPFLLLSPCRAHADSRHQLRRLWQLRHLLTPAALMVDSMWEDFEVAQLDCGFGYCIYHWSIVEGWNWW